MVLILPAQPLKLTARKLFQIIDQRLHVLDRHRIVNRCPAYRRRTCGPSVAASRALWRQPGIARCAIRRARKMESSCASEPPAQSCCGLKSSASSAAYSSSALAILRRSSAATPPWAKSTGIPDRRYRWHRLAACCTSNRCSATTLQSKADRADQGSALPSKSSRTDHQGQAGRADIFCDRRKSRSICQYRRSRATRCATTCRPRRVVAASSSGACWYSTPSMVSLVQICR